eukprot:CAMPEP_0170174942 /NCGR_PEP_ID=MMETSP0040_2-20121228/8111_1 /TAXON_ID=641309 /ORGANISM="Lotharella oceanica, Strain CCMP622" /LENGTH=79 /DNA_ID=CAMNT_0010416771 /DNA_START=122 /DNA_END=361 /DNA_ORIENTATION=-
MKKRSSRAEDDDVWLHAWEMDLILVNCNLAAAPSYRHVQPCKKGLWFTNIARAKYEAESVHYVEQETRGANSQQNNDRL